MNDLIPSPLWSEGSDANSTGSGTHLTTDSISLDRWRSPTDLLRKRLVRVDAALRGVARF